MEKPIEPTSQSSTQSSAESDSLSRRLHSIEVKLTWWIGLFSGIFFVLGPLGIWKVVELSKLQRINETATTALVEVLANQTRDVINRITVYTPPPEQRWLIDDLTRLRDGLAELKPSTRRYKNLSDMVDILPLISESRTASIAYETADAIVRTSSSDPFCHSRALVLRALALFRMDRKTHATSIADDLQTALHEDGSIATAFNVLGIMTAYKAEDAIKEDSISKGADLIRLAHASLRTAIDLDPSAMGTYKPLNNLVWSRMIFLNALLDHQFSQKQILELTESTSMDEYFAVCRKDIAQYRSLLPERWVGLETEAQAFSVMGRYHKELGDKSRVDSLVTIATIRLIAAIDGGLAEADSLTSKSAEKIWEDPLLGEIKQNPHARRQVEDAIRKRVP